MLEVQLETLKKRGINPYQAVLATSREARVVNDKVLLGILEVDRKPTTLALEKLIDGRVVITEEESPEG